MRLLLRVLRMVNFRAPCYYSMLESSLYKKVGTTPYSWEHVPTGVVRKASMVDYWMLSHSFEDNIT